MDELIPRRRFYQQIPVEAQLSVEGAPPELADVILEYSSTGEGSVRGYVLGAANVRKRLAKLVEISQGYLKFKANQPGRKDISYSSSSATLTFSSDSIGLLFGPSLPESMPRRVAEIRFTDLALFETNYFGDDARFEPIRFTYAGDTNFLMALFLAPNPNQSFDYRAERHEVEIALPQCFACKLVITSTFQHEWEDSGQTRLSKQVFGLELTPLQVDSTEEAPPLKLLTLANHVAQVASFMGGQKTRWTRAQWPDGKARITMLLNAPSASTEIDKYRSYPTRLFDWPRELLAKALTALMHTEEDAEDIAAVIDYLVQGEGQTEPGNRFALFFFALERLKNLYSREKGLDAIFDSTEFKPIKRAVKQALSECITVESKHEAVLAKLGELNRWPSRAVIEKMMASWQVTLFDLYPPGQKITLFNTRNLLMHSNPKLDANQLYSDQERLKVLVQRLILRCLGWEDLSKTPEDWVRNWLTKPSVDSQ
ncbi:MAG: hypothetical protein ABIE70_03725 [bacterium]